jgi:hypothetical protein
MPAASIEYPGSCAGTLSLAFPTRDEAIDWSAQRIENAVYTVQDRAAGCLPSVANCYDEYTALIERSQ